MFKRSNLSAKEAKQISTTIGKKILLRDILKEVKRAAKHGDDVVYWDFDESRDNFKDVVNELKKMGYKVTNVEDKYAVDIKW